MINVIYIIFIFTICACSSTRTKTPIVKQPVLEEILLTSIQESSYLKNIDTIYLYDHFSFDTDKTSTYYRSINAYIQFAFVDTFSSTVDQATYPTIWNELKTYKDLKDTRSRIDQRYFNEIKNKTVVFVTEADRQNHKYKGKTKYYPSLILPVGSRQLFSMRYGSGSYAKIIYIIFEEIDGKYILKEEQDHIAESNAYVIEDWINQINFDQPLESYWKNDYVEMVKIFDNNWEKECIKITGSPCQRVKLIDQVQKGL